MSIFDLGVKDGNRFVSMLMAQSANTVKGVGFLEASLDREDIFNLSHEYQGMVTYALTTLEEMNILNVAADDHIRHMVALVCGQAQELQLAIARLAKNPRVATDHAHEVGKKERQVERLYRAAIKDLFAPPLALQDLPALFYRREVYRHISNMSHRADAAANVFGMVVMKLS